MPTFTSLQTSLNGTGQFYEKSSRHATYNFNQDAQSLYRNHPRLPFEYYISINLNNLASAAPYIAQYFNNPQWAQVMPLVKSVEMPSMKIETTPLNQYNRKRLSQTKVMFEPVKMVFHDVADGKTLKFWEMYYRYYFGDGTEPGINNAKQQPSKDKTYSTEELRQSSLNGQILPTSVRNSYSSVAANNSESPINTLGNKSTIQNIVADTLDNHGFGFNLPTVQNVRTLIQSIDIFQVHGGRFNQVTLVNPRISAFTHDVLNYAVSDKTVEITFSIEYEYAYYTLQNMKLGGREVNNTSTLEQFDHGDYLELESLSINSSPPDFLESNNPLLVSDNPVIPRIGNNVQSSLGTVTGAFASTNTGYGVSAPNQFGGLGPSFVDSAATALLASRASSSVLGGLINVAPSPYQISTPPLTLARPFMSTAVTAISRDYRDMNRIGGNPGG